jgi:hypothetical protein
VGQFKIFGSTWTLSDGLDAVIMNLQDLGATDVFVTHWRFAFERFRIYEWCLRGELFPWRGDYILLENEFSNTFRAADRVSQYVVRNVI